MTTSQRARLAQAMTAAQYRAADAATQGDRTGAAIAAADARRIRRQLDHDRSSAR